MTTTAAARPLRIGEVAERTGVTPRTIRYYEEIGLLPSSERGARESTGSTTTPTSSAFRS